MAFTSTVFRSGAVGGAGVGQSKPVTSARVFPSFARNDSNVDWKPSTSICGLVSASQPLHKLLAVVPIYICKTRPSKFCSQVLGSI
ncbi:hypothetical protein UPYG_G00354170 [Umbra pygmaea]|uniref:Uncharacterized protein n=1 Tax=Umbra pygmaea TaxID=75934 RepID=A0ABD0WB93_UMBPY